MSHTGFGITLMAKKRELLSHSWIPNLFSKHPCGLGWSRGSQI